MGNRQMSNADWSEIKILIKIKKLQKGLKNSAIGEAIGLSSNHVSSVINGYVISNPARKKICDFLGIEYNAQ